MPFQVETPTGGRNRGAVGRYRCGFLALHLAQSFRRAHSSRPADSVGGLPQRLPPGVGVDATPLTPSQRAPTPLRLTPSAAKAATHGKKSWPQGGDPARPPLRHTHRTQATLMRYFLRVHLVGSRRTPRRSRALCLLLLVGSSGDVLNLSLAIWIALVYVRLLLRNGQQDTGAVSPLTLCAKTTGASRLLIFTLRLAMRSPTGRSSAALSAIPMPSIAARANPHPTAAAVATAAKFSVAFPAALRANTSRAPPTPPPLASDRTASTGPETESVPGVPGVSSLACPAKLLGAYSPLPHAFALGRGLDGELAFSDTDPDTATCRVSEKARRCRAITLMPLGLRPQHQAMFIAFLDDGRYRATPPRNASTDGRTPRS